MLEEILTNLSKEKSGHDKVKQVRQTFVLIYWNLFFEI